MEQEGPEGEAFLLDVGWADQFLDPRDDEKVNWSLDIPAFNFEASDAGIGLELEAARPTGQIPQHAREKGLEDSPCGTLWVEEAVYPTQAACVAETLPAIKQSESAAQGSDADTPGGSHLTTQVEQGCSPSRDSSSTGAVPFRCVYGSGAGLADAGSGWATLQRSSSAAGCQDMKIPLANPTGHDGSQDMAKRDCDTDSDGTNHRPAKAVKKEALDKVQERLVRNRESAQLSRQRKKMYVDELEAKVQTLQTTVQELNKSVAQLSADNAFLRGQLAYFCPPPAAPMQASYAAPGRFRLPLPMLTGPARPLPVPIPRLPVQSATSSYQKKGRVASEADKKPERKRARKAAAGAVMLGLFCFALVLGPFTPGRGLGGDGVLDSWGDGAVRAGGRVLLSEEGRVGDSVSEQDGRGRSRGGGRGEWWSPLGMLLPHELAGWLGIGVSESVPEWVEQSKVGSKQHMAVIRNGTGWEPIVALREGLGGGAPAASLDGDAGSKGAGLQGTSRDQVAREGQEARNHGAQRASRGLAASEGQEAQGRSIVEAVVTNARRAVKAEVEQLAAASGRAAGDGSKQLALRGTDRPMDEVWPIRPADEVPAPDEMRSLQRTQAISRLALALGPSEMAAALPAWAGGAEQAQGWTVIGSADGAALPMLYSGMCVELFDFFDPSSGEEAGKMAGPPTATAGTVQAAHGDAGTKANRDRNDTLLEAVSRRHAVGRRLRSQYREAVPLPPARSEDKPAAAATGPRNNTVEGGSCRGKGAGCRDRESVVVSILVPRQQELVEEVKGPAPASGLKALHQIFVVVLVNSVNYITYSCSVPSLTQPVST